MLTFIGNLNHFKNHDESKANTGMGTIGQGTIGQDSGTNKEELIETM